MRCLQLKIIGSCIAVVLCGRMVSKAIEYHDHDTLQKEYDRYIPTSALHQDLPGKVGHTNIQIFLWAPLNTCHNSLAISGILGGIPWCHTIRGILTSGKTPWCVCTWPWPRPATRHLLKVGPSFCDNRRCKISISPSSCQPNSVDVADLLLKWVWNL